MAINLDEDALNIYTDGSSLSNPRRGGIGVRFVYVDSNGDEEVKDFDCLGFKGGTNNQMELQACITGLEEAFQHPEYDKYDKILVLTDSMYVRNNQNNLKYVWPNNQWNTKDGTPVLNLGLWKTLRKILVSFKKKIKIKWVKGHDKDKHNIAVDKLAKKSARNVFYEPLQKSSVRRKQTDKKTVKGSVGMEGQRLTIRIIETQSVRKGLFRYRYEVLSKKSIYYKCADWIFSEILSMRDGHTYYARVNKDNKNPQIIKCFREII